MNELVAFSNSNGGILLIGVDDNGDIIGLKDGEEDIFLLEKLIDQRIYPKLSYNIEKIPISRKREVVQITVKEGIEKPYYVNESGKNNGTAYVRFKDESVKAGKILRMMLNYKYKESEQKLSYEREIQPVFSLMKKNEKVSIEDLSIELKINKKSAELLILKLIKADLVTFDVKNQNLFYAK